jgi:zinc finger SWIM domain-containing protein 3
MLFSCWITRSIVTYSGASAIKSHAPGDKRKRPPSKNKASKNNKKTPTPNVPGTAVQASANNVKQPRPVATENDENRVFQLEFGSDVAFATPPGGASTEPGILDQQNLLALVDATPR